MKNQEFESTVARLKSSIQSLETRLTETEDSLDLLRCFLEDIGIVDGQRLPWEV